MERVAHMDSRMNQFAADVETNAQELAKRYREEVPQDVDDEDDRPKSGGKRKRVR